MKNSLIIVFIISLACMANSIELDPTPVVTNSGWLAYDDGTPAWFTWDGTYRGVWFNLDDFVPGCVRACIEQAELWFYHDSNSPWDTSDFYLELWNGDAGGPSTRLNQSQMTAIHYSPSTYTYPTSSYHIHSNDNNFWCLVNTEMSSGGWPSSISDAKQGSYYHSFYSDDFVSWEPWDVDGACHYLIRLDVDLFCWESTLERTSWGSLKALF